MTFRFFNGPVKASQALFAGARTRVNRAVGHFANRINRVEVRIAETTRARNGMRHGPTARRCVIQATASGAGIIVVESSGDDFYTAVNHAAAKLKRALNHKLGRQKKH